jgi:hypothetical protein
MTDEISILRFFETGPIEKAEVVFNIVREKMRERLSARSAEGADSPQRVPVRKRKARPNADTARETAEPSGAA